MKTEQTSVATEDAGRVADYDVLDTEKDCERIWQETKGLDKEGRMWLTPRMERNATAAVRSGESAVSECTNHFSDGSKIFPNRDCCVATHSGEKEKDATWDDVKQFVEPATNSAWNDYAPERRPAWGRVIAEDKAFHIAATAAERACKRLRNATAAAAQADTLTDTTNKLEELRWYLAKVPLDKAEQARMNAVCELDAILAACRIQADTLTSRAQWPVLFQSRYFRSCEKSNAWPDKFIVELNYMNGKGPIFYHDEDPAKAIDAALRALQLSGFLFPNDKFTVAQPSKDTDTTQAS